MRSYDVEVVIPSINPRLRLDGQPRAQVTIDDMVFDAYIASVDRSEFGGWSETRISLACTGAPVARKPATTRRNEGPTYVERMRRRRH